jgi:RNA polymerase sigma factor (sigma-70 family)
MKTPDIIPFEASEKRKVLRVARETGVLPYDDLDRLLLDALKTQAGKTALLRALQNVVISDSRNLDDLLYEHIDTHAEVSAASGDDYRLFAQQVRSLRRLTRSEEHLLARRLEFARERLRQLIDRTELPREARDRIIDRGITTGLLGSDENDGEASNDSAAIRAVFPVGRPGRIEQSIAREYARLREHFVERNLYLVIGMSSNYRTYGLPAMDLIQEGNASLIRAVEKFDWRKEVRFQTYAAFWVRQAIERLITANRGMVRVPNYIQQKMRRFRREGLLPRNQKDMDVRDVSKLFEVSAKNAARLMETDRGCFSLDAPLGEDNDSFASILEAEPEQTGMGQSELSDLHDALHEVMGRHLTPQEREIIAKRYGLGGTERLTLEQIGEQMGVSRERVRQMQVKAIGKLNTRGLLDELEGFL